MPCTAAGPLLTPPPHLPCDSHEAGVRRAQAHPSRGRVLLPSPTSTASRRCGDRLRAADERRVRPKRRGSKEAQASSGVCRGAQVQARSVAPTSRLWLLLKRIATARRGELKR